MVFVGVYLGKAARARDQPPDGRRADRPTNVRDVMARQESGKAKSSSARADDAEERNPDRSEWADEAAKARSLDDPRRMPPRDAAGMPSSGDRYAADEDPRDR